MSGRRNSEWSQHIDQIIRSRHYTWLAEGLGGEEPESALKLPWFSWPGWGGYPHGSYIVDFA